MYRYENIKRKRGEIILQDPSSSSDFYHPQRSRHEKQIEAKIRLWQTTNPQKHSYFQSWWKIDKLASKGKR